MYTDQLEEIIEMESKRPRGKTFLIGDTVYGEISEWDFVHQAMVEAALCIDCNVYIVHFNILGNMWVTYNLKRELIK